MKYLLFIFFLGITFFLPWCIQKTNLDIQKNINTSTRISTETEQFIETDFASWNELWWTYTPLYISWNTFIVSWFFSFSLPKNITKKAYTSYFSPITHTYTDYVWFSNNEQETSFMFYMWLVSDVLLSWDEQLCSVDYVDGYITKSEKTYTIQWQKIYAYYATLMVHGPDFDPFKVKDTQFCFIYNWFFYRFSASNYTHIEMNQLINSFTFLD